MQSPDNSSSSSTPSLASAASSQPQPLSAATLLRCSDSIDGLHRRMDRFYAWASQLQVEHRDLKQRISYLEGLVLLAPAGCAAPEIQVD